MKKTELNLDILPSGEIRFCRCSPEKNKKLLEMLKDFGIKNISDLEEFFNAGNSIEQIFGDEQLCG
jgi:redox-regulated HSP33 family molecular chaperone